MRMRLLMLMGVALVGGAMAGGQTIIDYRGLEIQSPDPTGAAGLRLQNNFKALADRIGPANLTATAAPTVDDDVDEGYYAGSLWYDTVGGVLYWCADNTDGAAVWHDLSTSGGSASISDIDYAESWNGVTTIAPSKNALYDYLSGLASVYQAADADLTTWAGVTSSANGRSLVSAADYAAMKTLLAYGTMADQAASSVAITGGTISGVTLGQFATSSTAPSVNGQSTLYLSANTLFRLMAQGSDGTDRSILFPLTNSTALTQANIGVLVQEYDADLTTWANVTPSANGRSLVSAADYAAMRGLLSLDTDDPLQFLRLGLGGVSVADRPLTAYQTADNNGIKLFGFDDMSNQYLSLGINLAGNTSFLTSGNLTLQTEASKNIYLDCGGKVYGRDRDSAYAERWTIDSATGEIAILSNTAGLKLNASGTTTIVSDTSNLTLTDPTTGAKTLAQLAADTDTLGAIGSVADGDVLIYNSGWARLPKGTENQVLKMGAALPAWAADTDTNTTYSPGDGLDLDGTEFKVDLKSGGGLEIDDTELRLSTHESAAIQAGDGATATLDFSANAIIKFTFDNNGGATTFTFTDPPAGARCLLILIQDADGSETVEWPAAETIYWADGTAFQPDGTASARAVVTLVFDGTDYYCTGYDYATP